MMIKSSLDGTERLLGNDLDTMAEQPERTGDHSLFWIKKALESKKSSQLMRKLVVKEASLSRNFSTNDYLGLRFDSRVHEAGIASASKFGSGGGSSPAVSGWSAIHEELCATISEWKKTEKSLLFPSGFAANQSVISALVEEPDAVYLDRLAHACLVDGARLSKAKLRVFPHNDTKRLREILVRDQGRFRRRLIVTESVFSMDGDQAPLGELADLASQFNCMTVVDEAHATGVYGEQGGGLVEALGLSTNPNLVRLGTLSKAIGTQGGFVSGSSELIEWLVQSARGWIYSTVLSPYLAGAALKSIQIIHQEPQRRKAVHERARNLRKMLVELGLEVKPSHGPIIPVMIGDPAKTVEIGQKLAELGFLVGAIRPPTVPAGTSRIRMSVTANHSEEDIRSLIDALRVICP